MPQPRITAHVDIARSRVVVVLDFAPDTLPEFHRAVFETTVEELPDSRPACGVAPLRRVA